MGEIIINKKGEKTYKDFNKEFKKNKKK